MVTIPASATVPEGLTFTVGQITWTTCSGGLTTTVSKETQIRSEITTSPTTRVAAPSARPPFPLYKEKKIDCSLDRADSKLLEVSQLVDGILRQPDQAAPADFFKSRRPTRVATHERLGTSLTITSTPSGRSVKLKKEDYPCGLNNSASLYSRHTQSVFSKAGWSPKRNGRHYVNMVTIRELRDGQASSTNSSTGSVPTEVINTEDEDYDLDLPSHPPGFPRFPVFPPRRGDIVFNVSADEPVVDGETDEQRQLREQRNADRARRRADEQIPPHNLNDAFDMVGDQPVYKTTSANVAVAMANLDRLPNAPECQGVRTSIRANLIAAMGQTATLLKRVQDVSYTEAASDQTNRSRASPSPSGHHRSRSPDNR